MDRCVQFPCFRVVKECVDSELHGPLPDVFPSYSLDRCVQFPVSAWLKSVLTPKRWTCLSKTMVVIPTGAV
jgi:hypothetical protein